MTERERVVNQTLLIWSAVVVIEIFVIAHLMAFPVLILTALVMFWPIKAALNWPKPLDKPTDSSASAVTTVER
ncbi:MAG TPA: hypothetical protein DCG57_11430 [Candidatus Riflebacteria bacterium]|jgi:hypothetical protein|nr:MAG: hypothetical protein CVV41_04520 [Candidatus Riflebacteria bacterium HGW-Riflebacteria-1]HAE39233.1 hypothetical protein [Candidatus Riflebacteria bacterium]